MTHLGNDERKETLVEVARIVNFIDAQYGGGIKTVVDSRG